MNLAAESADGGLRLPVIPTGARLAIDFVGLSYLDTQDLPYSGMHAGVSGLHLA